MKLNNYISISPELEIGSGYDQQHPEAFLSRSMWNATSNCRSGDSTELMEKKDRQLLADEMIQRWEAYKLLQK